MCFVRMFQWEQSENVLAKTKKMEQYIEREKVCTARKHGRLWYYKMSLGLLKKGSTHLDAKIPLKNKISYLWTRAHGLLKHDITKAKDNDIINIGQQVNNSLQLVLSLTSKLQCKQS